MLARVSPPAAVRTRPSWWWFVLGAGLLVSAVAAGIGLFVWTLGSFLATDVTVRADQRPHAVSVPTDGDRMLWFEERAPETSCRVIDTGSGEPVALEPVTGSLTRDDGGGGRVGAWRIDPGSGRLEVTCTAAGPGVTVEVGPAPSLASFGLGLLVTIAVPLVLGGLGLTVLLVAGILWSTRTATRR